MEIFNILAGVASILSLVISIVTISKVIKIEKRVYILKMEDRSIKFGDTNISESPKQTQKGSGNIQAGGYIKVGENIVQNKK